MPHTNWRTALGQQNQSIKRPRARPRKVAPALIGKPTARFRGSSSSARREANLQLASAKRVKHQLEILLSISFLYLDLRRNGAPSPANRPYHWGRESALLGSLTACTCIVSVPHPFAFFLAKGWESKKLKVRSHAVRELAADPHADAARVPVVGAGWATTPVRAIPRAIAP